MTEAQQKFKEKIKKDLNYEVDFATYHITRGRGWSKADGACSATIDAIFTDSKGISGTVELFLQYPLKILKKLTRGSDYVSCIICFNFGYINIFYIKI